MRFFKTPRIISALLPGLTWRKPGTGNTVYLTFDDGPIPEVTPFILAELEKYQAGATFFCVGENLQKHPVIARQVKTNGHLFGNHTHNHVKGWKTTTTRYVQNIQACNTELEKLGIGDQLKLFRPPHGRFTVQQYRALKNEFRIIMWDVLTYDFDAQVTPETCLQQAIKNTQPGSVVVFHDSQKARRNLEYVLPRYLAYFAGLGYQFKTL